MTPTRRFADIEPILRSRLPDFAANFDKEELAFDPDDDDQYRAHTMLDHLRLWLLGQRRPWRRKQLAAAFQVIEELCRDGDDDLLGALAVALLEGSWPRQHFALMGPATRKVRDLAQRPPWGEDDYYKDPSPERS